MIDLWTSKSDEKGESGLQFREGSMGRFRQRVAR